MTNRIAIAVPKTIGVGDALQFSSIPENFYKTHGEKLVDSEQHWMFDHNPYVEREKDFDQLINPWLTRGPNVPRQVYLSMAERNGLMFKSKIYLNRPRLYKFEGFPYEKREMILLHTEGASHGHMPPQIINHVIGKYGATKRLYHIGLPGRADLGIPKIETPTLWDLAELIAQARMVIDVDSGPAWIGTCYPDVVVKKVRMKPYSEMLQNWIPLEVNNASSHWDDRATLICNPTKDDIGFTSSYLRL
jgi:hypothetical protein